MAQPSLGSGNSLLQGGNQALQDAIQRRNTGQGGQLQSQTPASAGFDPSTISPQLPSPQSSPASTVPSNGMSAAATGASLGAPTVNTAPENDLILKTLAFKLKQNSSIEKAQSGVVK